MNECINKILELDQRACAIAKATKDTNKNDFEKQLNELKKNYENKIDKDIMACEKLERERVNKRTAEIVNALENQKRVLDEKFEAFGEHWANEIFERLVK